MKLIGNLVLAILLCIPQVVGGVCIQGDCINGHGTAVLPDGGRYFGEFREGGRNGKGSMTYPDGTNYVGAWLNDEPNGKGTLISIDRSKYTGEFVNGVRHGQGTLKIVDGRRYEGQWWDDVPHGLGKFIDPGREEFVGQFENGRRNGQGEATYRDGTKYEGQWADDLPNGQGIKTLAGGMQYLGNLKNGLMFGSGKIVLPDGSQFKIQWQSDTHVEKEEIESRAQISDKEEQKDWFMILSLKELRGQHSQEPQESVGHVEVSAQKLTSSLRLEHVNLLINVEVSAQELASSPEPIPPQKPEVAVETAEEVSPQPPENENPAIKEQAQQMEADNNIPMVEFEKMTPEAVMPAKGEEGSGSLKGYTLYYETTNGVKYVSIAKGANIRSDSSLTSEVLRTVPPGYPVAVQEQQEDWFLVQDFMERKGWVYASLLTEPETVIIKVYKGNLRSGPSLTDDVIVQLDHGTVVSVVETRGDWLRVSDSGNLTGWLHRKVIWP